MTRVGIWLTAQRPEGAYTVAADLSRLPGVHVVARPEDALPTGTRRVSVYRFLRTMTVNHRPQGRGFRRASRGVSS
jgi:hypothetical protein